MPSLILGDCLEEMKQIPDGSVDMVLADPPYGLTACAWDVVIDFQLMWEQLRRITKPSAAIALFGSEPFGSALRMSNIKNYKYDWVWVKERGTDFFNSKRRPLRNNEQIIIFYTKQPLYRPQMRTGFKPYKTTKKRLPGGIYRQNRVVCTTVSNGDRYPLNTLSFSSDKDKLHPTQKPLALMQYLIRTYTNQGETVLDFTMGSGTTGVACKSLNRSFIGIEQDASYFNIARSRIESAAPASSVEAEEKEVS